MKNREILRKMLDFNDSEDFEAFEAFVDGLSRDQLIKLQKFSMELYAVCETRIYDKS